MLSALETRQLFSSRSLNETDVTSVVFFVTISVTAVGPIQSYWGTEEVENNMV